MYHEKPKYAFVESTMCPRLSLYHNRGVVCETYLRDTERSPVNPTQKPQRRFTDCLPRGELCSKPNPDPFGSHPNQFRNAQYS